MGMGGDGGGGRVQTLPSMGLGANIQGGSVIMGDSYPSVVYDLVSIPSRGLNAFRSSAKLLLRTFLY